MIEVVFAILMIQNGAVVEYVPTGGMADCLEQMASQCSANRSRQRSRSTWEIVKESSRSLNEKTQK